MACGAARTMLPGSRYPAALLLNTAMGGPTSGPQLFPLRRHTLASVGPGRPGGTLLRLHFFDAGICRTPREKPDDRTPTNRLTDARTKSRSLASAAAPASASMAARCAIQILWTSPGLAISGRRGNGSAGESIHIYSIPQTAKSRCRFPGAPCAFWGEAGRRQFSLKCVF